MYGKDKAQVKDDEGEIELLERFKKLRLRRAVSTSQVGGPEREQKKT